MNSYLYSWESLGHIKLVNPKGNQSWIFIGRIDAETEAPILWPPTAKRPTHWKRPGCWERLQAGGEGDDRGWDGWMASLTRWKWVSVNSGSWWWTGRPGVLWFMGSQRVGHDWATDLIWSVLHKEMYLFQCYLVNSSHPLLPTVSISVLCKG